MSFDYQENLPNEAKVRYKQKLDVIGVAECPYKLPKGSWSNDPTKWPAMEYGDLYTYLIDTPGIFTRESMKNKKSLEAYIYYQSGWVENVLSYHIPKTRHTLLHANVKPSQRVNDTPHKPWVALTTDGTVTAAHCTCMAGLGESCSHVAALLFKVEAFVRLGITEKACTDVACKWNNDFVRKVNPDPISKISFYKDARVQKAKTRNRKRTKPYSKSTPNEQQTFLKSLSECDSKPVVLSCFDGYSENFHWKREVLPAVQLPQPLRKLYSPEAMSQGEINKKCKDIFENMKITPEEISLVEKCTSQQSDCLAWYEQRCGRVTSSVVHSVLHTNNDNPAHSIIKQICFPETVSTAAINWGRKNEKTALKAYTQLLNTVQPPHIGLSVQKTGLRIAEEKPFLGASADSITTCQCHGTRVVEVKCPHSFRNKTLQEFLSDKKCCIKDTTLKREHKYYAQVQLQMYVYKTDQCDFFVWTEKFCVLTYVKRDNEFIEHMLEKSSDFFKNHILCELLTRRQENKGQIESENKENVSTQRFCVCQQPEDNRQYVGCDNPQCQYKWLHLDCLKLKKAPKGEWYCPTCRKQKSKT